MTFEEFTNILESRDIKVILGESGPRLKGPRGSITAPLLGTAKIHKQLLIEYAREKSNGVHE